MSIRKIIDIMLVSHKGSMTGLIASSFYQIFDSAGNWSWACDVDIGVEMPTKDETGRTLTTTILKGVLVATNNRDLVYAEQGKGVTLARSASGAWTITGLSKVRNSDRHYIYVSFEDDIVEIVSTATVGRLIRPLTYGELADYGGYGILPYGCQGEFDAAGNFIKIVGWS